MKRLILIFISIMFVLNISAQETGTYTDIRDGHVYKTVKIGNQTWMAENFAYKTKGNCWAYKNKRRNAKKYGRLYDWETAKRLAPNGWHLPTQDDFVILLIFYNKHDESKYSILRPNGISGFLALFAGIRNTDGDYEYIEVSTKYWLATELSLYPKAKCIVIGSIRKNVSLYRSNKCYGLSVRYLKDN